MVEQLSNHYEGGLSLYQPNTTATHAHAPPDNRGATMIARRRLPACFRRSSEPAREGLDRRANRAASNHGCTPIGFANRLLLVRTPSRDVGKRVANNHPNPPEQRVASLAREHLHLFGDIGPAQCRGGLRDVGQQRDGLCTPVVPRRRR
jgi:hypothetical protein